MKPQAHTTTTVKSEEISGDDNSREEDITEKMMTNIITSISRKISMTENSINMTLAKAGQVNNPMQKLSGEGLAADPFVL